MKTKNTLKSIVTKTNLQTLRKIQKNVFIKYQVSVINYIGQRLMPTSKNEHKYYKENKEYKLQMCRHAWYYGHRIQFKHFHFTYKGNYFSM